MKNLENLIRKKLHEIADGDNDGYMFIQNIETMHGHLSTLIKMMQDEKSLMAIKDIMKEHEWAVDHLTTSKDDIEEVFNFLVAEVKDYERINQHERDELARMDVGMPANMNEATEIDEGKNVPTNKKLWARAKSMAKSKFKVYPSAYANGWAAKWYKKHGGGWKKKS